MRQLPDGLRFAYHDARRAQGPLLASAQGASLAGESNPVVRTLAQLTENRSSTTYAAYNDEPPGCAAAFTGGAHAKGVLAVAGQQGFWLVHSIPKFPDVTHTYGWEASTVFGQTLLCITASASDIDGFAKQVQTMHPHIYQHHLGGALSTAMHQLFAGKSVQLVQTYHWTAADATAMLSFAKAPSWGGDLYEDLVEPTLQVSAGFAWETWRRAPKIHNRSVYTSANINMISLGSQSFSYDQDHSKWGISLDSRQPYVCVGDINRMQSQRSRGGGTVCFKHPSLWHALNGAVAARDICE